MIIACVCWSDHPRIRGEHPSIRTVSWFSPGSSPHTRGALLQVGGGADGLRIIPAYAGSTDCFWIRDRVAADHPRIRGEHSLDPRRRCIAIGSSPHTRGARRSRVHTSWAAGIIPAYAGSTFMPVRASASFLDHPRIRGEHDSMTSSAISAFGSSPHTRGALFQVLEKILGEGIIPAYAGSTDLLGDALASVGDHPRIRGEHEVTLPGSVGDHGSSPHTRGARDEAHRRIRVGWIIPAYAGSTG